MTTLADATLELAKILGDVVEGTATGGSTTTLIDTSRPEATDYFDNGTIWFLTGNAAGKSAVITNWDGSTDTFTFATQSAAIQAGNRYAATPRDFPRYALIQSINRALRSIGAIPQQDTSLTVVDDQEEYTLPNGVYNLMRVEIATEDAAPYKYRTHNNWHERDGKLVFDAGHIPCEDTDYWGLCDEGRIIRLTYMPLTVTELDSDEDEISEYIHPDRLIWEAAVHALRWKVQRHGDEQPENTLRFLNEALANAERMRQAHPVRAQAARDAHLAGW